MNSFDIVMEMLSDKEVSKFKSKEEGSKKLQADLKEKIKEFQKNEKIARSLINKYSDDATNKKSDHYKEIKIYVDNAHKALSDASDLYFKFGSIYPINKTLDKAPSISAVIGIVTSFLIVPLVLTLPTTAVLSGARNLSENKWKKKYDEYKALAKSDYVEAYNKMYDDINEMATAFVDKYEPWI